jgi:hypothetical protein
VNGRKIREVLTSRNKRRTGEASTEEKNRRSKHWGEEQEKQALGRRTPS